MDSKLGTMHLQSVRNVQFMYCEKPLADCVTVAVTIFAFSLGAPIHLFPPKSAEVKIENNGVVQKLLRQRESTSSCLFGM